MTDYSFSATDGSSLARASIISVSEFHLFRFVIFNMVVTQKMQATVHHHVCPVRFQRLLLLFGFLLNHLAAMIGIRPAAASPMPGGASNGKRHVGQLIFPRGRSG